MNTAATQSAAEGVVAAAWQRLFAATVGLMVFSQAAWVAGWLALSLWAVGPESRLSGSVGLLGASLLPGLAAIYWGFRVRLDAGLLTLLETSGPVAPADFAAGIDRFRAQLAGRELVAAGNPLAARYTGVFHLWRRCLAALALQIALMVGATGLAVFEKII